MDFIVKLPVSSGYDSILVVVDRRTKMAHFIPCLETTTASELATLFFKNIFKYHGLPNNIVSDRGPQFKSTFWSELLRLLDIKPTLSTAFHPQTDGQTERVNSCLEQYLRCFVDYQQDDWFDLLPYAEFAYNNSHHASIGTSPFFANFGYHPKSDLLASTDSSNIPAVTNHLDKLKDVSIALDQLLARAATDSKRFADTRRSSHDFKIGDQVMLLTKNLKTTRPTSKLDYRKIGPFKIIAKINDVAFRLQLPSSFKIHNVFHVSLLERFHRNIIPGRVQDQAPPPELIEGEEHWGVDQIVDSRIRRENIEYLVKWTGLSNCENEWLPQQNLEQSAQLVIDFHAKYPLKPRLLPPSTRRTPAKRRR